MRICSILIVAVCAGGAWAEPRDVVVGDPLRRELLDLLRPEVEVYMGPPVVFLVRELRVEGDRAFGRLRAERPGGVEIDFLQTPAHLEMGWSYDLFDGPRIEVFFHQVDGAWEIPAWEIGATDAWWFGYDCAHYAQFYEHQACGG